MKTKKLASFKNRDNADIFARESNKFLELFGESIDKFAFTEYDSKTREYAVKMIFGQSQKTVKGE